MGPPHVGAWWVWDARLTSVLVLFLFYLAYMALRSALDDEAKAVSGVRHLGPGWPGQSAGGPLVGELVE